VAVVHRFHHPWDSNEVAFVQRWPFFKEVDCRKLEYILSGGGIGCSLMTGGYFLEVVVSSGLTVYCFSILFFVCWTLLT
jgi:hypothetical protein